MSQENVEIVRGGFAAWNAGDMDALGQVLADDVVLRLPEGWPEPGPYLGRKAAMRQSRRTARHSMRIGWNRFPTSLASAIEL